VLPLVVVAGAAKLGVHALGWDTVELNPLYSALFTATVFLLGFLLAGTLVDYKESERLPGDISSQVQTIVDECLILHQAKGEPAVERCLNELQNLARDLNDWLRGKHRQERVLRSIDMLSNHFFDLEEAGMQATYLNRLKLIQADIRRMVIRIQIIRETSFVMAGYAIAQLVSVVLITGLLFVDVKPFATSIFFVCMISFFLWYMIFLIKDLDDPFDYSGSGPADAEVSLKALDQLEDKLAASVGPLTPRTETAPAGALPSD
jgi:hypothetical protein